jgi:hypothetical protein
MKVKKQGKVTTVVVDGALIWPFATQIHHEQPLGMFYVNLIGPYTLKGRDNSQIDFMALTMVDPQFQLVQNHGTALSQMTMDVQCQQQGGANS